MDLFNQPFRLFAYVIALQVALGCLVSGRAVELDGSNDGAGVIQMIHPTMHRAFLFDDGSSLLETNNLALIRSNNASVKQLVKYLGGYDPDVVTAAKISSSSTNYYPYKRKPDLEPREVAELRQKSIAVVRITYDNEIDTYRKAFAALNEPNFGRGGTCNKQPFRAFDMVRISKPNNTNDLGTDWAVAVGFSDTHLCLFYYQSFDPSRVKDDPFGTATQVVEQRLPVAPVNDPKANFRVASATIFDRSVFGKLPGLDVVVEYYDEAGQVFQFFIKSPNTAQRTISDFKLLTSLTSVNLIEGGANLGFEDNATKKNLNDERKSVMQEHFEHSFVESICMFEGSLMYSRGLFQSPWLRIINRTTSTWPQGPASTPESSAKFVDTTIVAHEAYKLNETFYYHFFDIQREPNRANRFMKPQVFYWWCVLSSRELAIQVSWPNKSEQCQYAEFEPARSPIDVVYREKCNRIYAFYQHLVQWEAADKKISRNSSYTVLQWMRFPVNAILHHKDRLYLFGPGNSLRISDPIGDDCTFESLSVPSNEYYQSDLLFMMEEAAGEMEHPGLPFYDSGRYLERRGADESWSPPLDEHAKIPEHLRLSTTPSDDNDDTTSTMLIIAIVAIVVLGLVGLYFYFLHFGRDTNKQPSARAKSRMRSKKSRRSPDVTNKPSTGSPKATPATLSDSPTVRSSQHEPSVPSKMGADLTVRTAGTGPSDPLQASKRRQSPRDGSSSPSKVSRSPSSVSRSPSEASRSPGGIGTFGRSSASSPSSKMTRSAESPKSPKSPSTTKTPEGQTKIRKLGS